MEEVNKIEEVIQQSHQKGIAILIKIHGKKPFVTAVEEYIDKGSLKLIVLKDHTLYGLPLEETVIHLHEVEGITPFHVYYNDPVYIKVREIKKLIKKV